MKFRNVARRVALVLVVLLSVGLSFIIWTNDQNFERKTTTDNTSSNINESTDINQASDTFLTTEVLFKEKNQLYQIYDRTKNIPLEVAKILQKVDFLQIKQSSGRAEYEDMIASQKYIQLVYPDAITVKTFFGVYDINNIQLDKDMDINRIFVPRTGKSSYIVLGDDDSAKMIKLSIKDLPIKKINKLVADNDQQMPIKLTKIGKEYTPFYQKPVKLNVFSYLIARQSESYYITQLLGTGNVSTKTDGAVRTYSLGIYQRLRHNTKTHRYDYTDYRNTSIPKTQYGRFKTSYANVSSLGGLISDVRYFERSGATVSYRNYTEGLPIFMASDDGQETALKTSFSNTGFKLSFTNEYLQIPIPTDGRTVTLPPTSEVFANLKKKNIVPSQIQRIELALVWSPDASNTELIDLTPTYYIEIGGRWLSYLNWLDQEKSPMGISSEQSSKGAR